MIVLRKYLCQKKHKTKQRTEARKRKRLLTAWLTNSTTLKLFNNCLTKKDRENQEGIERERKSPSFKSTSFAECTSHFSVVIGFFLICNGGIGRGNDFRPESKVRCTKGKFLFLESP